MNIRIIGDMVEISGYVNAVERNSKPLLSRIGRFIERIRKGAFSKAIARNGNIHILLNHDWARDLGSTAQGNLSLREDSIGLYASAMIQDAEVAEKGRNGDLIGWSFGFNDVPEGVEMAYEETEGLPLRLVKDLDLAEVSILDRSKSPAYEGTLIMARDEGTETFISEAFVDEVTITEVADNQDQVEETREQEQPQQETLPEAIDYGKWERLIAELKGGDS